MSRRPFQFIAGFILILATLTRGLECRQIWDKSPAPAYDTELQLTAWFVGVGIVLTLARHQRYAPIFVNAKTGSGPAPNPRRTLRLRDGDRPEATGSPPAIPLRI